MGLTEVYALLPRWEWVGILLARLAVGLLFLTSGQGKLFDPARRQQMVETMKGARVPNPSLMALLISLCEFVFGAMLVLGLLTPLATLMLIGVMLGALVTTILPGLQSKPLFAWLGDFLYLPEVLYLVLLIWILFAGPGRASVDALLTQGNVAAATGRASVAPASLAQLHVTEVY